MRPLTVLAIVLTVSGSALAQGGGASITIGPRPQPQMHQHHFGLPVFLGGSWYPSYTTDIVQTPPQVIVLQAPAPPAPVVKEDPKPIIPLMIELQGGQYVRSDRGKNSVQQATISSATSAQFARNATSPPAAIIPATLIYRDGHHEQVHEYTIADGAIYAQGDYWQDGYWNKKIPLSSLDIPATVSTNRSSGSNFELPSAPNVVIVRP
ncbi:MAG TPA: hypothetical protein VLK33_09195 [Terriglobales bacterium]|nr:hypothetical protein [Terriglobales bacterium]